MGGFGGAEPEKYKILFLENLPKSVRAGQLEEIFSVYTGFAEVRLISERGVAFVEFYSDDYAAVALNDLKGPNSPNYSLLTFKDESAGIGTGATIQASINFGKK